MSAEMLETIKRQAEALTSQEKLMLGNYLLEQAQQTNMSSPDKEPDGDKRNRRAKWLNANRECYGGQYVALEVDELVATGRTMREAKEAARAAGKADAFVTYLPKPDFVGEMGGWA